MKGETFMNALPSRRTIQKFGRDLLLVVATAAAGFAADNVASLGLSPTEAMVAVAVTGFVYRWLRGLRGGEPVV